MRGQRVAIEPRPQSLYILLQNHGGFAGSKNGQQFSSLQCFYSPSEKVLEEATGLDVCSSYQAETMWNKVLEQRRKKKIVVLLYWLVMCACMWYMCILRHIGTSLSCFACVGMFSSGTNLHLIAPSLNVQTHIHNFVERAVGCVYALFNLNIPTGLYYLAPCLPFKQVFFPLKKKNLSGIFSSRFSLLNLTFSILTHTLSLSPV